MKEHKNTILAVVLSILVVVAWQYFIGYPQMQKEREQAALKQQEQSQVQPGATQSSAAQPGATPQAPEAPGVPNAAVPSAQAQAASREVVVGSTARVAINTPRLGGSIDLKGGRIDDLTLTQYRDTIDPTSPPIVLFSPSGAPDAYYADFGWVPAAGTSAAVPGADTVWTQQGSGALGIDHPITLDLRQWRGSGLHPHHRRRRPLSLHRQRPGSEQGRQPGDAVSLCADFAPRHAGGAGLLHSARRPDRRDGRARASRPKPTRRWRTRSPRAGTPPTPGSASPTNIGRRRCCPTPTRKCSARFSAGEAGA